MHRTLSLWSATDSFVNAPTTSSNVSSVNPYVVDFDHQHERVMGYDVLDTSVGIVPASARRRVSTARIAQIIDLALSYANEIDPRRPDGTLALEDEVEGESIHWIDKNVRPFVAFQLSSVKNPLRARLCWSEVWDVIYALEQYQWAHRRDAAMILPTFSLFLVTPSGTAEAAHGNLTIEGMSAVGYE